jgi:hypothetical protein
MLEKPPRMLLTLSLKESSQILRRKHVGKYILQPLIGPSPSLVCDLIDSTVSLPILAESYPDGDLTYHFDTSILSEFRSAYRKGRTKMFPKDKLGFDVYHFPFVLKEIFIDPTAYESQVDLEKSENSPWGLQD